MNILFTCAGRRNYLINYFKDALQGQGKIVAVDTQLSAPALVDADIAIKVPSIYEVGYLDALKEIIMQNQIRAVISLNDLELPLLSKHKSELEALGAKIIVADEEVISISFDKWRTFLFLRSNEIKAPQTYIDIEDALMKIEIGEMDFPVVLKPRWGSASIGIEFPENLRELKLAYELLKLRMKRSILSEASKGDVDHCILIQEKITGDEFGMDILNDFEGNYFGTFVRKKLAMRAGETDKAVSIIDLKFEKIGKKIASSLGHIGNLDCDVFEHHNELYVLELNPRFGGGYPFSHEAGMNTASAYIEWLHGGKNVSQFNNYISGLTFSKCDRLIPINTINN